MSFHDVHMPGDPTLVLLHGTGGSEGDLVPLATTLSKRMGYLGLRGKEPERGANRWFRRIAEGIFDEENLILRSHELADHVENTLPEVQRIAVGFSNGANIAAATLLLRPDAFDGAILMAPMVPLQPEQLPMLEGKPILMICGRRDALVPVTNAQVLASMFETAGADLTVHWHDGGHNIGSTEVNVASSWLSQFKGKTS